MHLEKCTSIIAKATGFFSLLLQPEKYPWHTAVYIFMELTYHCVPFIFANSKNCLLGSSVVASFQKLSVFFTAATIALVCHLFLEKINNYDQ